MSHLSQATLMMLSPLLKHCMACKAECLDDVCLWSDEKDSPRESVGGSMAELELGVIISDTVEALFGTLCFTFPCPSVSSSIGFLPCTEIIPEPTPN